MQQVSLQGWHLVRCEQPTVVRIPKTCAASLAEPCSCAEAITSTPSIVKAMLQKRHVASCNMVTLLQGLTCHCIACHFHDKQTPNAQQGTQNRQCHCTCEHG